MEKGLIESIIKYKGYQCAVVFQPSGHRCGYVLVPYWHHFYEQDYDYINHYVQCHGGLTYSSHEFLGLHYPSWWIGFDCNHAGDLCDKESQIRYFGKSNSEKNSNFGSIKDLEYCINQCKYIVNQLVDRE